MSVKESAPVRQGPPILLPLAAGVVGALCLHKIIKACSIPVHPNCVSVVYDTRRRIPLCTTADSELRRGNGDLPRVEHFTTLFFLSKLLIYCTPTRVIAPPSLFYGVFTLPRSVFTEPGEAMDCSVEGITVTDGVVDMVLTIHYCIRYDSLERYLAAVGPVPPNETIAMSAAHVVRQRSNEVSVGILLSKARREAVFLEMYQSHLATKLMSEAAVRLLKVVIENVELVEK